MKTVKRNQQQYDLPLKILSYDELYGWTMDRIVETVGRKNNCMHRSLSPSLFLFLRVRRFEASFRGQAPSAASSVDRPWIAVRLSWASTTS